ARPGDPDHARTEPFRAHRPRHAPPERPVTPAGPGPAADPARAGGGAGGAGAGSRLGRRGPRRPAARPHRATAPPGDALGTVAAPLPGRVRAALRRDVHDPLPVRPAHRVL